MVGYVSCASVYETTRAAAEATEAWSAYKAASAHLKNTFFSYPLSRPTYRKLIETLDLQTKEKVTQKMIKWLDQVTYINSPIDWIKPGPLKETMKSWLLQYRLASFATEEPWIDFAPPEQTEPLKEALKDFVTAYRNSLQDPAVVKARDMRQAFKQLTLCFYESSNLKQLQDELHRGGLSQETCEKVSKWHKQISWNCLNYR